MLKRIREQYYSKLTLICVGIVCIFTGSMLFVSNSVLREHEKEEYLLNYEIASNNLSSILSNRISSFMDDFSPLCSDSNKYDAICDFYLHPTKQCAFNEDILQTLSSMCNLDQYCRGVLLLTRNGRLYQYDKNYGSLVQLPLRGTTFLFTPYSPQFITDSQLDSLSNNYEKPAAHVFGLCGTIFSYADRKVNNLGYIIFLYSTDEFSTGISDVRLNSSAISIVSDKKQNVIYSSTGNYKTASTLLSETFTESGLPFNEVKENGNTWYASSNYNSLYRYNCAYFIPQTAISLSQARYMLILFGITACLLSALLYIIAFRFSNRKVQTIRNGMRQISHNHLEYRILQPKGNDEFSQIIRSFNDMCDKLQRYVEKAYIYEINQRKAELYAMQTSINPHFLYNALEQIRVHIMSSNSTDAAQMLLALSKMYRNQSRRDLYISIGQECSQIENILQLYLYIHSNFEYEFDINPSIKKYGIPKNTLQPLVENFFTHGIIPDSENNFLTISAFSVLVNGKKQIEMIVEDNGFTISDEDLKTLQNKLDTPVLSQNEDNGFALSNVNARLKIVFGKDSTLHLSAGKSHQGFRVSFQIPPILPEDLTKQNCSPQDAE